MKRKLSIVAIIICAIIFSILIFMKQKERNIEHRLQWWLDDINWDEDRLKYTGQGITIAVLDTGIDSSHPDLSNAKISEIRINSLNDENGNKKHGTAIAGIIAAFPNNDKGVLGIAVNTKIISVDVTNETRVDCENLVKGVEVAIEQGVDIINISIGVKNDSDELHQCIRKAYDLGIVVIAAAGNYMIDEILYPAAYEEVICVGAYDKNHDIISPKGNISKSTTYLPGDNIVTANSSEEKLYVGASGTSFSAAILSGIVSLMLEAREADKITKREEVYNYFNQILLKETINVKDCISYMKERN